MDRTFASGMAHAFALVILLILLTGCVSTDPCAGGACVGPYDLGLSSHREALLGKTP